MRYDVVGLSPYFGQCRQVATVDNGLEVDNEAQGQPIVVCRHLQGTWDDVWPQLRRVS